MVYLLLAEGFEEVEALTQADYLRRAGIEVALVGVGKAAQDNRHSLVSGGHGIKVAVDCCIDNVSLDSKTEMLVLPGGMGGIRAIAGDSKATGLIAEAVRKQVLISAICAAPTVLADLGLLRGVQAVCYPGMECALLDNGAKVGNGRVCRDGIFLTSLAAGSSEEFAFAIIERLRGKDAAQAVRQAVYAR